MQVWFKKIKIEIHLKNIVFLHVRNADTSNQKIRITRTNYNKKLKSYAIDFERFGIFHPQINLRRRINH